MTFNGFVRTVIYSCLVKHEINSVFHCETVKVETPETSGIDSDSRIRVVT